MAISKAITGIDNSGSFRVYMAISTDAVQQAHEIHHTSPAVTYLLGRALTGSGLMGLMLREPGYRLSLQFRGDGPVKQILCAADSEGHIKGYAAVPAVELPEKEDGTADPGAALGSGSLTCIRDGKGMEEPYIGQIELVSGEIAEDIASYFYQSEQIRTLVNLGVKLREDGNTASAGGLIVQLLPDADDRAVQALENWMPSMPSISELAFEVSASEGTESDESIMMRFMEKTFEGMPEEFSVLPLETPDFQWQCDCSESKLEQVLISLGADELDAMIEEDGEAEMTCQFCEKKYHFDKKQLQRLSMVAAARELRSSGTSDFPEIQH